MKNFIKISTWIVTLLFFSGWVLPAMASIDVEKDKQGNNKGFVSGTVWEAVPEDEPTTPVTDALVVAIRFNNAADAFGNPSRPILITSTNEDGYWEFPEMPSGNFLFTATAPGFHLARSPRVHVKPRSVQSLDHYLVEADVWESDDPGTLTGRVVRPVHSVWDDDDDPPSYEEAFEPVPDVYVTTFRFDMDEEERSLETLPVSGQARTNENGKFQIQPLDPGLHMIVAQLEYHRPSVYLADIVSTETTDAEIILVRSGDNPSTFSTVNLFKTHRPGYDKEAQWRVEGAYPFQSPLPGERNGWLFLRARNNGNSFGYWQSTDGWLHRIPGSLYQVQFEVATDQDDPSMAPGVRLRANSSSQQQSDMLRISSLGDAGLAPTREGRTYNLFFEPLDTNAFLPRGLDRINLSFDLINIDPSDAEEGEIILKSLDIRVHPLNLLTVVEPLKKWDFEDGPQGWESRSDSPPFDTAEAEWSEGALELRDPDPGNTFDYWSSPSDAFVAPEAGSLIRALFLVRSNQGDPSLANGLRVRMQGADHQLAVMKVVPSVGEGYNSPGRDGKIYPVYFEIPPALGGEPILFAIDVLGFDPGDAEDNILYLEEITVEKVEIAPSS